MGEFLRPGNLILYSQSPHQKPSHSPEVTSSCSVPSDPHGSLPLEAASALWELSLPLDPAKYVLSLENVAQLVESLSSLHVALGSVPSTA